MKEEVGANHWTTAWDVPKPHLDLKGTQKKMLRRNKRGIIMNHPKFGNLV